LHRLSERLFDFAAAQANHVRVFLFAACFVMVLFAGLMRKAQFISFGSFSLVCRPVLSIGFAGASGASPDGGFFQDVSSSDAVNTRIGHSGICTLAYELHSE
jgi:hypothetical protein